MLDLSALPGMFTAWRARYVDRDARHYTIDRVASGDFDAVDPDEEKVEVRSPNMVQVAIEDTAEAASLLPTIRAQALKAGPVMRSTAKRMERIAAGWFETNEIEFLIPRSVMDAAAYGFFVWTINEDPEQGTILWERRDPRQCYPEPGYRPGDTVRRAMFARKVFLSQLPADHQEKLQHGLESIAPTLTADPNMQVILIDWYDEDEYVLAGLISTGMSGIQTTPEYTPVELERIQHRIRVCPVIIGNRLTLDGEFRGQFDQVVDMLLGHVRLMSLAYDYSDQAVYSDIWVRDLIGEMPFGGGSFIELGPNGAIGRVPPAVSSLNVQADLQALIDGIHLGGRWPKSRPGEIEQNIASAKFLETSVGLMNTAIRTYHLVLKRALTRGLNVSFELDRAMPGTRRAVGVLRNQTFAVEYDPSDIDLRNVKVRVEYGLGLGRDPSQSAVLHIQYGQNKYISRKFVQENIDGLTDVDRVDMEINQEDLEAMAKAKILQGLESGEVPPTALPEIYEALEKGETLMALFKQYVAEPAAERLGSQVETGIGPPVLPGAPAGGPPLGPGGPPGPSVPAPPGGADLLARMNVPAGPGGTLGSQILQQGG